jgi:hypothetical protein
MRVSAPPCVGPHTRWPYHLMHGVGLSYAFEAADPHALLSVSYASAVRVNIHSLIRVNHFHALLSTAHTRCQPSMRGVIPSCCVKIGCTLTSALSALLSALTYCRTLMRVLHKRDIGTNACHPLVRAYPASATRYPVYSALSASPRWPSGLMPTSAHLPLIGHSLRVIGPSCDVPHARYQNIARWRDFMR